jgi:rare lipoprotein A
MVLRRSSWQLNLGGVLALMSLLFAASCSTQATYQPPPAVAPAPAPPPAPPPRQSRAKSTGSVKASYQGDEMAGRRTASGEVFDPDALTAASRTLPIGSTVIVTNPETGKSVKVRINDRGPHVRGRSLDLSRRAAEELGITEKGVARLKVERVDSKSARSSTADAGEESVSASTH